MPRLSGHRNYRTRLRLTCSIVVMNGASALPPTSFSKAGALCYPGFAWSHAIISKGVPHPLPGFIHFFCVALKSARNDIHVRAELSASCRTEIGRYPSADSSVGARTCVHPCTIGKWRRCAVLVSPGATFKGLSSLPK